jgi:hypothetical protein
MYLTELFRLTEINVGNVTHGDAEQYYGYSLNYNEIMKMFVDFSFDKSFKKMGTIAYKGIISRQFISMFKTWKIKGTDYDNSQSKDYKKFYNKQKSTKQYFR